MLGRDGGLLVAPGAARALADGLIELLRDGDTHWAGRARAQAAAYGWDRLALEWMQVYG
jgi:glycosyltransferase involved in cell wall biosynthesis